MGHAARQEDMDDRLGGPFLARRLVATSCLLAQKAIERQPQAGDCSDLEEHPPARGLKVRRIIIPCDGTHGTELQIYLGNESLLIIVERAGSAVSDQ